MDNKGKDKIKELLDKVEKGVLEVMDSEKYKEYLKFQSMFHNYSTNNIMLIFSQKPTATAVAGYKTWQKLGRQVQKGEKGIKILAPCIIKKTKEIEKIDPKTLKPIIDSETGKPIKTLETFEFSRFKKISVFDISQTEGKEVPSLITEIQTNSKNSDMIIKAIKKISEVPITFETIKNGAKGYFLPKGNRICISEGMSKDQTVKTMIHEYTHSILHGEGDTNVDKATKELQAESTAFIVSNRYGIDTSEYSFGYLASWSGGKDVKNLKQSFDIIQKTSHEIIEKLDETLEKELEVQRKPIVEDDELEI
jgi:antirestriction protein ArdC